MMTSRRGARPLIIGHLDQPFVDCDPRGGRVLDRLRMADQVLDRAVASFVAPASSVTTSGDPGRRSTRLGVSSLAGTLANQVGVVVVGVSTEIDNSAA